MSGQPQWRSHGSAFLKAIDGRPGKHRIQAIAPPRGAMLPLSVFEGMVEFVNLFIDFQHLRAELVDHLTGHALC